LIEIILSRSLITIDRHGEGHTRHRPKHTLQYIHYHLEDRVSYVTIAKRIQFHKWKNKLELAFEMTNLLQPQTNHTLPSEMFPAFMEPLDLKFFDYGQIQRELNKRDNMTVIVLTRARKISHQWYKYV
jgi:hypothetical protein